MSKFWMVDRLVAVLAIALVVGAVLCLDSMVVDILPGIHVDVLASIGDAWRTLFVLVGVAITPRIGALDDTAGWDAFFSYDDDDEGEHVKVRRAIVDLPELPDGVYCSFPITLGKARLGMYEYWFPQPVVYGDEVGHDAIRVTPNVLAVKTFYTLDALLHWVGFTFTDWYMLPNNVDVGSDDIDTSAQISRWHRRQVLAMRQLRDAHWVECLKACDMT